jgi:hypothetical protein
MRNLPRALSIEEFPTQLAKITEHHEELPALAASSETTRGISGPLKCILIPRESLHALWFGIENC